MPDGEKAYFLSDIHLGASHAGNDREKERQLVEFLSRIKEDVAQLYLLGDILDYWYEYRYVVPRGFVRFFGKLAELADNGVEITWLIGNHDIWIFDYLPTELGVSVVDGVLEKKILGVPFCMQHGDAIVGNTKFRFLRKLFRNKVCQKLYGAIHPRWTVGFASMCSRRSRLGQSDYKENRENMTERYRRWCEERIEEGDPSRYFLFGHLHKLKEEPLRQNRSLIVLPEWPGYAEFDGNHMLYNIFR